MKPVRINFEEFGIKPATLEERLETIQKAIADFVKSDPPMTETNKALLSELLNRKAILKSQIQAEKRERELAGAMLCKNIHDEDK